MLKSLFHSHLWADVTAEDGTLLTACSKCGKTTAYPSWWQEVDWSETDIVIGSKSARKKNLLPS